jgi:hypothetical protein
LRAAEGSEAISFFAIKSPDRFVANAPMAPPRHLLRVRTGSQTIREPLHSASAGGAGAGLAMTICSFFNILLIFLFYFGITAPIFFLN